MNTASRLVVISNRLPVTIKTDKERVVLAPSSGGLVTALKPILGSRSGTWVGWGGAELSEQDLLSNVDHELIPFQLAAVNLSKEQVENFYLGFSNQIIWPLFHDRQGLCNFDPQYWQSYQEVLRIFAERTIKVIEPGDVVWVQDFHLMGLGRHLRAAGVRNKIGFFLHIPFPSPDIFFKLPWRRDVLTSLIDYDLIGFHTERDLTNFRHCCVLKLKAEVERRGKQLVVRHDGRIAEAGAFPISIDFEEFNSLGNKANVRSRAEELRRDVGVRSIILSVDRLDYTKGIPNRIVAFREFLRRHPEFRRNVAFIQVVVPSREEVEQYADLKEEIEKLVTQVNGEFAEPGWVPVQHLFRSISRDELAAMYLAADVALVTPLKDGMNLVAKEFCATQTARPGVLVLSEFAGAAAELGGASLLVNPYDVIETAETLAAALTMNQDEVIKRMKKLRRIVKKNNVYAWADSFLGRLNGAPSEDAPPPNHATSGAVEADVSQ